MSFSFRGRPDLEGGIHTFAVPALADRRQVRVFNGARPGAANSNPFAFLISLLLLFTILNSQSLSPAFLMWLGLGVFLTAMVMRMYSTCQQLQAQLALEGRTTDLRGWAIPPSLVLSRAGADRSGYSLVRLALLEGRELEEVGGLGLEDVQLDYDALRAMHEAENGSGSSGLGQAEIERLPVHQYKAKAEIPVAVRKGEGTTGEGKGVEQGEASPKEEKGLVCSVCLENVTTGEIVRTLPCLHMFHSQCVDPWLVQSASCPICKHKIASGAPSWPQE